MCWDILKNVRIIEIPKVNDPRGNLSFFENSNQIPFDIKRTYWIYDVPGGAFREGHASVKSHEFIIALSGSFDVDLNDGKSNKTINLNRSFYGLYVPNLIWRSLKNFSTNSVVLIVSSVEYNKNDYVRDFKQFQKLKNEM